MCLNNVQFLHHTIQEMIIGPVLYLKYDVLETGFCLRLQVEATQLNPLDKVNRCGQTDYTYCVQMNRFRLKTETGLTTPTVSK
jgi:hypothetical protein